MSTPQPHGGIDDLKAEFPFGIAVTRDGLSKIAAGVATCAVRRSTDPARRYLMSCRHVLSLSLIQESSSFTGMTVSVVGSELEPVGQPTDIRGSLAGAPGDFDAQLARLEDPADAAMALHGLTFQRDPPYVRNRDEMASEAGFWVATGRRGPDGERLFVWVDYEFPVADFTMDYTLGDGTPRRVTHALVFQGKAHDTLGPGDSGSPAVMTQGGSRLIGMYIGGDGVSAYVIPAWQLLNPLNFGVGTDESWTLA